MLIIVVLLHLSKPWLDMHVCIIMELLWRWSSSSHHQQKHQHNNKTESERVSLSLSDRKSERVSSKVLTIVSSSLSESSSGNEWGKRWKKNGNESLNHIGRLTQAAYIHILQQGTYEKKGEAFIILLRCCENLLSSFDD